MLFGDTLPISSLIAMTTLLTAQPARHPNPTPKATSLAYLIFERQDLD